MISFNVKILFTNVPLDTNISIILRKIHGEVKIETNLPINLMTELLFLPAKTLKFHIQ